MAEDRHPTEHRMTRRSKENDYSQQGMYHITLRVADGVGHPFGRVVGDAGLPDGSAGAPHVVLSPLGQAVEHELLHSISAHYPMVEVQTYVVMPEHLHFILEVHGALVSQQGRKTHLGQVIAGFKKGCNRRYWELTGRGEPAPTNGPATNGPATSGPAAAISPAAATRPAAANGGKTGCAGSCPAVFPQGEKVPSRGTTGRPPLFAVGYVDVMPLHSGQLAQQRAYILANPRSRLLRSQHRDVLQPQRGGIDTALSVRALEKYLRRECCPWQVTPEIMAALEGRLLTTSSTRRGEPVGTNAHAPAPAGHNVWIDCDTYGDRRLLTRRLLPVVCHGRDAASFATQKQRCLEAAQQGAVMVSARIAKGEQDIVDTVMALGLPVIMVADNGFPDLFHPSAERMARCLSGQLLLVAPWQYHYRPAEEGISVATCKTMNCVAQALCLMRDDWWKCENIER